MPDKKEKLFKQVFSQAQRHIRDEGLKPGDIMPTEMSLCKELGVSRNVLRESMKSMELMGITEAIPGKGTLIKSLGFEFVLRNIILLNVDLHYD